MTMQVGSSLMAVVAQVELALRNEADVNIAEEFNSEDWILSRPIALALRKTEESALKKAIEHARKAQYSKLTSMDKQRLDARNYPGGLPLGIKHSTKVTRRRAALKVSHGQAISQTTFFFWKRLFSRDYEDLLWRRSLKRLFPNKRVARAAVAEHLEAIYVARNRIAHHEPVYGRRLDEAFQAIRFLRAEFGNDAASTESEFRAFTEVLYHRLYIDYVTFGRNWALLER